MADTFCILPWIHLAAFPEGSAKICCVAAERIAADGIPLSLQSHRLEDIWNSRHLRTVRAEMLAGRPVADCAGCYHAEKTLGASHRIESNARWRAELGPRFDAVVEESTRRDGVVSDRPIYYQLMPGNRCNLKCRMCFPIFSSRIEADPVHRAWSPSLFESSPAAVVPDEGGEGGDRLPLGPWYRDGAWIRDVLLADARTLRGLYLTGGEPMIEPQVERILDDLIARGVAGDVVLELNTNLTVLKDAMLERLERFRTVYLGLSIDAHGAHYEYIRYPARWDVVRRNVERLVARDGGRIRLTAVAVLQAYNVLDIVGALRFFDEMRIPYGIEIASMPWFLSIDILPARARRLAAARLRDYGASTCRPEARAHVDSVARHLEEGEHRSNPAALRTFMLFTNDLDAGRGQNFRNAHGELVGLLRESGFEWTDERQRTELPGTIPAQVRFR